MSVDHAKAVGATSSDDYFVTISSDSWRWRCISFAIFMGVSVFGRVFTPSLSTPRVIFLPSRKLYVGGHM